MIAALLLLLACADDKAVDTADRLADADHDGDNDATDCAPLDPERSHLLDEDPYDGIDNDCDDTTPDDDLDGDLFLALIDCDDTDPTIAPGAAEACDGEDNDCDDRTDEDFDVDGDGFLRDTPECLALAGVVDCDDDDSSVNPEARELCDGVDNDCTGTTDDVEDLDGDGSDACSDCDDHEPTIYPGAEEICGNGEDDDCDDSSDGCALEGDITVPDEAVAQFWGSEAHEYAGRGRTFGDDLDGDGDDELFLPAARKITDTTTSLENGRVYLMDGPFSGTLELADAPTIFEASDDYSDIGMEMGPAPDLDGDGYPEVWMGAQGYEPGGAALVFEAPFSEGTYDETDATILIEGENSTSEGRYGVSNLAWLGDVNDDGEEDLLVGSNRVRYRNTAENHAWLMYGPFSAAQTTENAAVHVEVDLGETLGRGSGHEEPATWVTTGHTDVADDCILSSPRADLDGVDSGGVFVIWASSSYLSSGDVSASDVADAVYMGENAGDWAGYDGAKIQDFNHDGYDDLVIGAPLYDGETYDSGAVYVAYGAGATGGRSVFRSLSSAEVRITLDYSDASLGIETDVLDDVTGDGEADIALASYGSGQELLIEGPPEEGSWELDDVVTAHLLSGSTSGIGSLGAADADGDGLNDLLISSYQDARGDDDTTGRIFLLPGRLGM